MTPEGVDLKLQLADLGQRIAAFLIDATIAIGSLVGLTLLLLLTAWGSDISVWPILGIIWFLGFFLLRNFYFILLESRPRAATFGKRAVGLRVVARDGGALTMDAVIARNMMREVEVFLPLTFLAYQMRQGNADALTASLGLIWSGIFLIFPLFNRDRLRAGDFIAGTWVIRAPRRALGLDLLKSDTKPLEPYAFSDAQLDAYGIYELQTLEAVLRRGDAAQMKTVADSIRKKIAWPAGNDDAAFLNAYYARLRARLERGLLFGQRRADKNDQRQKT